MGRRPRVVIALAALLLVLAALVIVPRVRRFIAIDTYLDHGGAWDYERSVCDGARTSRLPSGGHADVVQCLDVRSDPTAPSLLLPLPADDPFDASDQKRFVTDAGQPRWNLGLMALLGVLLFLAERRVKSIIVGGVLLVDLVVATVVHHSKLRRLGFPDAFRRRLAAISYLAGVLVLMVVAGVALKGR